MFYNVLRRLHARVEKTLCFNFYLVGFESAVFQRNKNPRNELFNFRCALCKIPEWYLLLISFIESRGLFLFFFAKREYFSLRTSLPFSRSWRNIQARFSVYIRKFRAFSKPREEEKIRPFENCRQLEAKRGGSAELCRIFAESASRENRSFFLPVFVFFL